MTYGFLIDINGLETISVNFDQQLIYMYNTYLLGPVAQR